MFGEKENQNIEGIDTSNIFEEFHEDSEMKEEVKNMVENQKKDIFYYLGSIGSIIQTLFWFLLMAVIVLYAYIFIQENEDISDTKIVDPFCIILLGDAPNTNTFCSSVASLNKQYQNKLKNVKDYQVREIISILESLYKVENFLNTKEITFLSDKVDSKLKVLKILEDFDTLKNDFEPIEKSKIQCYDIEINNENIFSAKCEAFSVGYENEIKGFDGTDDFFIKGTSISIANSFLNFIEKNSDVFRVIDRQKIFSSQSVIGENTGFTQKTIFFIKLKYSGNNLSL